MAYRTTVKDSRISKWAKTLALISLQLFLLTIILHRFAGLDTPVALNLIAGCLAGGILAILLAIISWVNIWNVGHKGAGRSAVAILLVLPMFAYPVFMLAQASTLPQINDISTDLGNPPAFQALAKEREKGANAAVYPGARFAEQQRDAYPDIQPIALTRPNFETFKIVQEAVRRMKWDVAFQIAPGEKGSTGIIEARDRTLLMGFTDDISIRVTGGNLNSRVDVRSASRYGLHDMGRNAERIRSLVTELKSAVIDHDRAIAAKRAAKIKAEKKRKAELARKKALRKKRRKRAYRARPRKRRVRVRRKPQQWPF